jgi:hypothetical protein
MVCERRQSALRLRAVSVPFCVTKGPVCVISSLPPWLRHAWIGCAVWTRPGMTG